jgi:cytidylate kinase
MIVTIAREAGSGGRSVAQALARRLQYHLVDRELIAALARETGVSYCLAAERDETVESWFERLTVPADFGPMGAEPLGPTDLAVPPIHETTQKLIRSYADQGNVVILGRGGSAVLAGRRDALHVFIYAPLEWRIRQIAHSRKITQESAREHAERVDRRRAEYLKTYYHRDWRDPLLYNLCIDTERLGIEGAVNILEWTLSRLGADERRAA